MADVTFTMSADLPGTVTVAQLRDGLCEQWGFVGFNSRRVEAEFPELTKAEFIEWMLLRYVKQTWQAYRGKIAGSTAQTEADSEVVEVT